MPRRPGWEGEVYAPLDSDDGGDGGGGRRGGDGGLSALRNRAEQGIRVAAARGELEGKLSCQPSPEQVRLLCDAMLSSARGQTGQQTAQREACMLVLADQIGPEASQVYCDVLRTVHQRSGCRIYANLLHSHQSEVREAAADALRWLADSSAGPHLAQQMTAAEHGGLGALASLLHDTCGCQEAALMAMSSLGAYLDCALELERRYGTTLARLANFSTCGRTSREAAACALDAISKTTAPVRAEREAAVAAAAAALLAEEEADAARQAAKAAAKAAKRQRQKEQQQQQQQQQQRDVAEAEMARAAAAEAAAAQAAAEPPQASEPADAVLAEGASTSAGGGGSSTPAAQQKKPRRNKRSQAGAGGSDAPTAAAAAPAIAPAAAPAAAARTVQLGAPASGADGLEELLQHLGVSDEPAAAAAAPKTPSAPAAASTQQPAAAAAVAAAAAAGSSGRGDRSSSASAPLPPSAAALDLHALADLCCCPITCAPFQHPVTAADGHAYERQEIEAWIAREQAAGRQPTSPLTGVPLSSLRLYPSLVTRGLVAALQAAGQLQP